MYTLEQFKADHPVSPAVEAAVQSRTALRLRLYALREDTGLSQARFAAKIGVTPDDVDAVEEGDFEALSVAALDRYAAAAGCVLTITASGSGVSPLYDLTPVHAAA